MFLVTSHGRGPTCTPNTHSCAPQSTVLPVTTASRKSPRIVTSFDPKTGLESRSNDGTFGSLSRVSYGTSYVQGGFWIGGLRNEVLFGGDAQYRTIYRQDLLRFTVPNSIPFNVYNPVYGLLQPGTTVSATDSDQTDKLGDKSYNAQLAQARAQAVAAELIHAGYPAKDVIIAVNPEAFGNVSFGRNDASEKDRRAIIVLR